MIMEPKLPQPGVFTQFSLDGVGRIRLDDGTELKVGAVALKDVVSFERIINVPSRKIGAAGHCVASSYQLPSADSS